MSDTENAAPVAANPTLSSDAKPEVAAPTSTEVSKTADKTADNSESKAVSMVKSEDIGEEKWELNGKSKDKDERRGERKDRNDRNGRDSRDNRDNDRRGGGQRGRGRGRGGGGSGGYQVAKRRNTEFEDLPETDDPVEIRNQVEFYFSTHNLVTDEHLFLELDGPENRPVPIKHITTFKRMRRFQPYTAVVAALRDSKDLVVVDDGEFHGDGNEAVKRKEPLAVPKDEKDGEKKPSTLDLFHRLRMASNNILETSVYVKDFGNLDEAGQIALEQFFRPYGAVMVRKRREEDGTWKGSVFVEFDSEDSQKQFLALDPKPKFNENELYIQGKKEYIIMKCKEKGIEPDFENGGRRPYNGGNRGGNRDHRGGSRGGRGDGRGRGRGRGRGGDRRDDRRDDRRSDRRSGRDRSRDRSPRRLRERSGSRDSVDSRDWNNRRDRFQKGKNDRGSRKEEERKEIERDGHGVPVVKDSRTDAEIAAASKKRKAGDEERAESPKKGKLEIKQDE
ncbi:hypothetical protein CC86DRAFT_450547 [Ophiobolus disseminans]|uniref:HTH La-type RNA-binding domain-containing protein n=1 Tax=Ophiobolus disseminans TaxID=1469910 RepID=A0A6A6ZBH7_9PLEO|nr:hypothetical protein CC86DRAFT_450547 [Ophiobolus disseminans]